MPPLGAHHSPPLGGIGNATSSGRGCLPLNRDMVMIIAACTNRSLFSELRLLQIQYERLTPAKQRRNGVVHIDKARTR